MYCYSWNDGSASCVRNNIIDYDSSQAVVTAWLDNLNGIAGRGSEIVATGGSRASTLLMRRLF